MIGGELKRNSKIGWIVKLFILFAVFSNFFGFFIVQSYADAVGIWRPTPFLQTRFTNESIALLAVTFLILLLFSIPVGQRRFQKHSLKRERIYIRGYTFFLLSAFILSLAAFYIYSTNWSFSAVGRGEGQWERDVSSALSRVTLLFVPAIIFYRVAFEYSRPAKFISVLAIAGMSISSLSHGDRRTIVYFFIALVLILMREGSLSSVSFSRRLKLYAAVLAAVLAILSSYIIRFSAGGRDAAEYGGFLILNGFLGGVGVGAIFAEIINHLDGEGEYLFGKSFAIYFATLFVPSFLLYMFGSDEFYFRPSVAFNDFFNPREGHGYDFMMVADFYWNFGIFGLLLYIVFMISAISFAIRLVNSYDARYFSCGVLLVIFLFAGQRSDFGFFLKAFVYCSILVFLLGVVLPKRRIRSDGG